MLYPSSCPDVGMLRAGIRGLWSREGTEPQRLYRGRRGTGARGTPYREGGRDISPPGGRTGAALQMDSIPVYRTSWFGMFVQPSPSAGPFVPYGVGAPGAYL